MNYKIYSHRHALTLLENEEEYREVWAEIQHILNKLTDSRLIDCFSKHYIERNKSLSTSINKLLREDFATFGWSLESPIFQQSVFPEANTDYWRLDMAKSPISIEVAFNHSGVTAWNLLKPVLASELNHVQKAIQTKVGVIICATQDLKSAGNFDGAIGTYEKFLLHLKPMMNQLSVPILIIGLEAPETFFLSEQIVNGKNRGIVTYFPQV